MNITDRNMTAYHVVVT